MGRALADAYPESAQVFAGADDVLARPISRLCFDGPAEQLALTENTQPAILAVSVAAWRALMRADLRPEAAAGHSLGEYAAHVAAGTISWTDALRAVQLRGRFMQEAVPEGLGAMAAILGLEATRVVELCRAAADGDVVAPANLNGPTQIVIAGHRGAVERALRLADAAGAKRTVVLPVSAPFHCPLMEPAAEKLRPVLQRIPFSDPQFPIYVNADARPVTRAAEARDALLRQVASPVRWQELVDAMAARDIDTFVEVGPGRVLAGLVRGIRRDAQVLSAADPAGVRAVVEALAA
jgi:[acyl-carrier-protein] S-malonyltransferase